MYANRAEERLFGYEPGELAGQPLDILNASGADALGERQPPWSGTWQGRRKDGTTVRVSVRMAQVLVNGRAYRISIQQVARDADSREVASKLYLAELGVGGAPASSERPLRQGARRSKPGEGEATPADDSSEARGGMARFPGATGRKQSLQELEAREEQFRTLVENTPDVVARFDQQLRFVYISPAVERLIGRRPDFLTGRTHAEAGVPTELTELLDSKLREIFESGKTAHVEFDLQGADGQRRSYHGVGVPEFGPDQKVRTVMAIIRDVTARKRAEERQREVERQLMLLVEASSALLAAPDSTEVLRRIMALAQGLVEADGHAVWRMNENRSWTVVSSAGLSSEFLETPAHHVQDRLPAAPLLLKDVRTAPISEARRALFGREGIRSKLAIPLRTHGEVSGSVVFYWRRPHSFTEAEVRGASALANLAASAVGTAALYQQQVAQRQLAEASERRAAFLAEAGAVLSSSLDFNATLKSVAELAVPSFADWAAVDIVEKAGTLRRVAVAHKDPEKARRAFEFHERFPSPEDDLGPMVVRTGQSVLLEEIPDEVLAKRARSAEQLELLRELGLCSAIAAPMILGEQVVGLITLATAESNRRYTRSDLRTAEELARRAASAVEHARLYRDAKSSEERLQLTLESAALGTFDFDPVNETLTCDARGRELLCLPRGQGPVESAVVDAQIHPDDRAAVRDSVQRALDPSGDGSFEAEYRVGLGGNLFRWLIGRGRVFFEEREDQRQAVRFMGTLLDITERKNAEQERVELLRREREAREVAEQLNRVGPVLAGELDRKRLMQTVTDIATSLTGAEFGALFINETSEEGEPFALYSYSGRSREQVADLMPLRRTPLFGLTSNGKQVMRVADLQADDAIPHPGVRSYLAVPVVSPSGDVRGVLLFGHGSPGVFQELHEQIAAGIAGQAAIALENARLFAEIEAAKHALQRSNEELRRANEDLNQFAYSASHDLQEPLRMVALYSQILQRNYAGKLDQDADAYLGYAVQGARRMEMLIRDLLAYTRAVSGTETASDPVDAREVLDEALTNLKTGLADSGAAVTCGPLPALLVNRVHLLQLFQNLIGNAIKYRGHDPLTIGIDAAREGAFWRICVRDNGIGVDPQYAERIFGIFRRLHTNEEYSGTGIGLAICQKIVDRYGGRIWVESQGHDRGSSFYFTLPGAAKRNTQ